MRVGGASSASLPNDHQFSAAVLTASIAASARKLACAEQYAMREPASFRSAPPAAPLRACPHPPTHAHDCSSAGATVIGPTCRSSSFATKRLRVRAQSRAHSSRTRSRGHCGRTWMTSRRYCLVSSHAAGRRAIVTCVGGCGHARRVPTPRVEWNDAGLRSGYRASFAWPGTTFTEDSNACRTAHRHDDR